MDNNYMKDLDIDRNNLHVECTLQPQLYMKYAEMFAIAKKKALRLKHVKEIVSSELDNKYRLELQSKIDNGDKLKITENLIRSLVLQDEKYQTAFENHLEAEFDQDIYSEAKWAFQDRKTELENLTNLYTSAYFSVPSSKTKTNSAQAEQRKILNQKEGENEDN